MLKKSVSVRLEKVTKTFVDPHSKKDVQAVREADFTIEPGELVTLLGPSGCGKTTTLRMVAGFEVPTSGRIFIGDEDITFLPPNKRDKAMVFQSYGLFPHMNVFDNVAYGLRLRKIESAEISRRVNETLELVGLGELGNRPPGRLSGGQQQRVALARALIVAPSVLLLDEPLSNLDALLREQMRVEIRRIQKSLGITALYVTHDRTEAMSLSDRVIVMNAGSVVQIGSPHEIYQDPVDAFVAGFIGQGHVLPGRGGGSGRDLQGFAERPGGGNPPFRHRDSRPGSRARSCAGPSRSGSTNRAGGFLDGRVVTNVYLGHSVESYVDTPEGEILVQVDNPMARRIYAEGEAVSVSFVPEYTKVFPEEATDR
jgi:ABC-type spermidine/putrescine transport systems, ATPase components